MPREFTHPNGEKLKFVKTAAETNGELLEMEVTYKPNSTPPPLHYHPCQEEQFEVLNGTFRAQIGDTEHTYPTGDKFTVPANTPHWMHNISEEEGRLKWQVRPAQKTQDFFATIWGVAANGKSEKGGLNILQLAVILHAYRNEFRPSKPPYIVQRIVFGILAPIGWLMGYQAKYAKYNPE